MTKTIAIVQARMGSQRFPGKSLTPLWNDVTLIELVLTRLLRVGSLDEVVLATSDRPIDAPLSDVANRMGVPAIRGDEQDVIRRFCDVTQAFPTDAIVRVCGDNPLIDPTEIDRLVTFFWNSQPCDYACNDRLDCGLPDGAGAEIFSHDALMTLNRVVKGEMREHVSFYITQNMDEFNVARLVAEGELHRPDVRLDIDYREDAEFVRQLIGRLNASNAPYWTTAEIIKAIDANPELLRLRYERGGLSSLAHNQTG